MTNLSGNKLHLFIACLFQALLLSLQISFCFIQTALVIYWRCLALLKLTFKCLTLLQILTLIFSWKMSACLIFSRRLRIGEVLLLVWMCSLICYVVNDYGFCLVRFNLKIQMLLLLFLDQILMVKLDFTFLKFDYIRYRLFWNLSFLFLLFLAFVLLIASKILII